MPKVTQRFRFAKFVSFGKGRKRGLHLWWRDAFSCDCSLLAKRNHRDWTDLFDGVYIADGSTNTYAKPFTGYVFMLFIQPSICIYHVVVLVQSQYYREDQKVFMV